MFTRKTFPILCVGLALMAAAGIGYVHLRGDHPPADAGKPSSARSLPYGPGSSPPPQAVAAARDLASDDVGTQRAALTPELDEALADGRLLPEGSRVDLTKGTWHQAHGYANAQATVTKPGRSAQHVLIGFARRSTGWRVTVVEVVR
ncbi:hypothetical protein [Streptomyces sp. NBC_01423]|uniref:hypothetical protein n=1 Tax=Streptomyces sp. NBC_01423 TaxID=2903860 RepID=UPI002E2DE17A|nr:hypothetical protein [Streptomyces sp. NBC_01423]